MLLNKQILKNTKFKTNNFTNLLVMSKKETKIVIFA